MKRKEGEIKLCPLLKTILLHGGAISPNQAGCPLGWLMEKGKREDMKGAEVLMNEMVKGLMRYGWLKKSEDQNYCILCRGMEEVKIYQHDNDIMIKYYKIEKAHFKKKDK